MKKDSNFSNNIAFGQEITTAARGHSLANVVFLLSGASYFMGVLHSSSLPDYIEDKKSGGQSTDCLKKWLCADLTIITGLAELERV